MKNRILATAWLDKNAINLLAMVLTKARVANQKVRIKKKPSVVNYIGPVYS